MAQSISPPQDPSEAIEQPKRKFPLLRLIPVVFVLAGVGTASWYFTRPQIVEPLQISGRIEGYDTDMGAKVAGRIESVAVREGDTVRQGQVIVRLDDDEIQAQLRGAAARLVATQQAEMQARLQINLLESQIQEMELNLQQAQTDTKGRVLQAESGLAASLAQLNEAEAKLKQAQSELRLAKINRDRYAKLAKEGAIPQQQYDQYQMQWETAQSTVQARQASVESFRKLVNSSQGQLVQAQTSQLNPNVRQAQLEGLRTQLAQTKLKLAGAQAEVASAKAAQQEIQAKLDYLNVVSPIDGVVTTRSVEPGAVVTTGKTLLTLINPKDVYLRGYVPEGEIGHVRIGQAANIFLDSAPNQPLPGTVTAIDTQASFTPENIYFKQDRVKQVFGIKISLDNPKGLAKPGMPADAEIPIELNSTHSENLESN